MTKKHTCNLLILGLQPRDKGTMLEVNNIKHVFADKAYSDFRMTFKNVFGECSLFVLSVTDEKIKTWTLRFPAKENPNMEKALFDWPTVLQYDVKAKHLLISRKFFGHEVFSPVRSLNQPNATRVCISSINQSNHSVFFRLLFCSRVFISRSHENFSNMEFSSQRRGMFHLLLTYNLQTNNTKPGQNKPTALLNCLDLGSKYNNK